MKKIIARVVLATSIDGKIALPNGAKIDIGDEGDRKVLENSLAWADATLMGGETLRAHKSTCLIHRKELIDKRKSEGRSEQPICIVVSNKKNYSLDWHFFKQPIERWLIRSKVNFETSNNYCKGYSRTIEFESNWSKTLEEIYTFNIRKLVVLGGSKIVGSMLLEDQISELQITLTPKLIGGSFSWIPSSLNNLSMDLQKKNSWILKEAKKLEDNELLLHYHRNYDNF
ncbi:RibD family protein [Prochlorococcus sp. MIT 1223]|uniref:RibD family protein n=1 Tax=Prochlorococcus sp. MIT 1223 TaxID=3096217 RepID=UPI002A75DAB3|nr:dihydrofolate reductase family protein [Prochlorococcus sp. MIT 1223]